MDDQTLHHFMEDLTSLVIGVSLIMATAWVISLIVGALRHRENLRAQAEFHNRLLEKFSSADEFAAYLQTEAGRRFFENITTERLTPMGKILGSIQKGAILTLLGIGLLVLGNIFSAPQGGNVMIVFGTIALMIGIGFLVSAIVSHRLAKTWGLVGKEEGKSVPNALASKP